MGPTQDREGQRVAPGAGGGVEAEGDNSVPSQGGLEEMSHVVWFFSNPIRTSF